MSADFDARTLDFYATRASDYLAGLPQAASPGLAGFLARLPAGGHVLELGCGGGRDAAAMVAAGFTIDATDASPQMVARAAARLPGGARLMRFDQLQARAAYDGIYAAASLLHAPRQALPGIFARIARALRPGGWHFASFKTGQAEGRDGFGRFFNYPAEDWLCDAYHRAGLRLVQSERYHDTAFDGAVVPWLALTTQR